ncbi:hypothetical protein E6C60_0186 [Paenibacillus algicola]|uniref:Uncharacterized protein n=1 Tax=Paenibacillus algicola TaxID=2565926 RepID=A0A4P8XEY2_9BACL|nr:hypothetical protein E6C60_0186 [Paenibacillus algicola]
MEDSAECRLRSAGLNFREPSFFCNIYQYSFVRKVRQATVEGLPYI